MFYFILKWIAASIAVSLFAKWTNIFPRFTKRSGSVVLFILNNGFLTLVLTLLISAGIHPSWILCCFLILVCNIGAVILTEYAFPAKPAGDKVP